MPHIELIFDELGIMPRWVRRHAPDPAGKSPVTLSSPDRGGLSDAATIQFVTPSAQDFRPAALATHDDDDRSPVRREGVTPSARLNESPAAVMPVSSLDWETLKARVAGCTQCKLCERRTQTVFGVGDEAADWLFVGEAPGEHEDRQGKPFVGQAGKLLDNMLRALDLARGRNVYIANVIKCRPPGNRNPELEEVARCEPYLKRQVALIQPKLIIAMGRFAAQSLLKSQASIASLRSRVHQYEGVAVIVTYHPAYLLRNPPDKAKAWSDLCLAQATYRQLGGQAGDSSLDT